MRDILDIQWSIDGRTAVFSLIGEFYLESIKYVDEQWNEAIKEGPEIIAIDCRKLMFIDSSAIGTLVKFLNKSTACHYRMVFIEPSEAVIRIFSTAKLHRIFEILPVADFERIYGSKIPTIGA